MRMNLPVALLFAVMTCLPSAAQTAPADKKPGATVAPATKPLHKTPANAAAKMPQLAIGKATAARGDHLTITLRLKNFGKGPTTRGVITAARLGHGKSAAAIGLPLAIPDDPRGGTTKPITLTFPDGVPAGRQVLMLSVTAGGRSLNTSRMINVP